MKSYILNRKKFLKTGSIEATMTSPDGIEPKYVDYSSYLNEELGRNLTLEEYLEVKKDKDLEVVEVLPPMKWHDYKDINIFFISEATSGSMHSCFIKTHDKKCYKALQNINSTDEDIYQNFKKSVEL